MIIKVCGMRDPENIREVAALGVDWIGLIFFAGSPRKIMDNGQWTTDNYGKRYPNSHLKRVGVFVNASFETLTGTAALFPGSITCNCTEMRRRMIAMPCKSVVIR